jgi:hypothetical protein
LLNCIVLLASYFVGMETPARPGPSPGVHRLHNAA